MPLRKVIAVLLVLFPGLCFGKSDAISESQKTLSAGERRVWAPPKRETEFAAAVTPALRPHPAAHRVDELARHEQPDTGPGSGRGCLRGAIEQREELFDLGARDPGPVVQHADRDAIRMVLERDLDRRAAR